jgi:hypothetical protein
LAVALWPDRVGLLRPSFAVSPGLVQPLPSFDVERDQCAAQHHTHATLTRLLGCTDITIFGGTSVWLGYTSRGRSPLPLASLWRRVEVLLRAVWLHAFRRRDALALGQPALPPDRLPPDRPAHRVQSWLRTPFDFVRNFRASGDVAAGDYGHSKFCRDCGSYDTWSGVANLAGGAPPSRYVRICSAAHCHARRPAHREATAARSQLCSSTQSLGPFRRPVSPLRSRWPSTSWLICRRFPCTLPLTHRVLLPPLSKHNNSFSSRAPHQWFPPTGADVLLSLLHQLRKLLLLCCRLLRHC